MPSTSLLLGGSSKSHHSRRQHSPSSTRKLSCSECRRLKLKCSRSWPCTSCLKRGCASICPTGSLTPGGGGNRFILHGSEELHKKIKEMGERIASLEDTVGCMWAAKIASMGEGGKELGEHPMLRKELLRIKEMPDTQNVGAITRGGDEEMGNETRDHTHHPSHSTDPNPPLPNIYDTTSNANAYGTDSLSNPCPTGPSNPLHPGLPPAHPNCPPSGPGGRYILQKTGEPISVVKPPKIKLEEIDGELCTEDKKEEVIVSGLGTLTIGDNGRRHYMGRSARIEVSLFIYLIIFLC